MKLREIRATARESLKGNWFVAIIASLIASVFSTAGSGISTAGVDEDLAKLGEFEPQEILITLAVFGGVIIIGLILSLVLSSLVSVGYAQFNIDLIEGTDPKIATMFSKGRQIWTTICAHFLVFIRTFFGFILFVVPGIIAIYKYAMVDFIIADNPGITARDALDRSKEIMRGNKFRFFLLGLSFFGWSLLVALTFGIAAIWVVPYIQASYAAFYKEIA